LARTRQQGHNRKDMTARNMAASIGQRGHDIKDKTSWTIKGEDSNGKKPRTKQEEDERRTR
jgi:hypothetical protein